MSSNTCYFCGMVGSQPIINEITAFNYNCLEVKKKDTKRRGKKEQV
jgi:hypothetical protein